jgi:hypothetical protein
MAELPMLPPASGGLSPVPVVRPDAETHARNAQLTVAMPQNPLRLC